MRVLHCLAPQFLLPAWNPCQLAQLRLAHESAKRTTNSSSRICFDYTQQVQQSESSPRDHRGDRGEKLGELAEATSTRNASYERPTIHTRSRDNSQQRRSPGLKLEGQADGYCDRSRRNVSLPKDRNSVGATGLQAQQDGKPDIRRIPHGRALVTEDAQPKIRKIIPNNSGLREPRVLEGKALPVDHSEEPQSRRWAKEQAGDGVPGPSKWVLQRKFKDKSTKEELDVTGEFKRGVTPISQSRPVVRERTGSRAEVIDYEPGGRLHDRSTPAQEDWYLFSKGSSKVVQPIRTWDALPFQRSYPDPNEQKAQTAQLRAKRDGSAATPALDNTVHIPSSDMQKSDRKTKAKKKRTRVSQNPHGGRADPGISNPRSLASDKKVSLLEELFPEEAKQLKMLSATSQEAFPDMPRLPPPEFPELGDDYDEARTPERLKSQLVSRDATSKAFRQENPTVLIFSRASKAMTEDDFRRIAPRGAHIEEWRGPGDIMRVIPGRDPKTLEHAGHYYLVFPNPAFARAYQNEAIRLHRLAEAYTPTSLESTTIAPVPGVSINGEDVHALLQDYALAPPTQRQYLRMVLPPYTGPVQTLVDNLGYPTIVSPENKSGRSVLLWVNGFQPTTFGVKTMLAKDGQDRGLQWGPLNGKGSIEALDPAPSEADGTELPIADEPRKTKKRFLQKWIIVFEDENEARRFVRTWHRMPYPFPLRDESAPYGEPPPLVHAEFLW